VTFEWACQQNVTGAARAEQVEATSKSELSMSTLQYLVCNLDYAGVCKPDIFRITTLIVGQIHSGTKFKAAFERACIDNRFGFREIFNWVDD
jgi:hypothetical protein